MWSSKRGGSRGADAILVKGVLYELLSLRLGIPIDSIWNEYGMTELSSQFYSNGIGRSHLAPPWLRFQVIDPDTNEEASPGKIGLLRIVDLANLWSAQAVLTQDLAIAQPDGGFLLLGRDPNALPRGCSRAMDELIQFAAAGSMKLDDRIEAVVSAATELSWLSDLTAESIRRWIGLELGQYLSDCGPQRYGNQHCLTVPLSPILHIVSGNTPHAALQSLIRGLIVGAVNWMKMPQEGLPEVDIFVRALPKELRPERASRPASALDGGGRGDCRVRLGRNGPGILKKSSANPTVSRPRA